MDSEPKLRDAFTELEDPQPTTSAVRIREMARQRSRSGRRWWLAAAAALVLFGGGVALVLALGRSPGEEDDLGAGRWRGAGGDVSVELGYMVEGALGLDGVRGGPVAADEQVVFFVTVSEPGYLCLEERSVDGWNTVFPLPGNSWSVSPGEHWPGGQQPQAFHTDLGPGDREYRVLYDKTSPVCGSPTAAGGATIHWEE